MEKEIRKDSKQYTTPPKEKIRHESKAIMETLRSTDF